MASRQLTSTSPSGGSNVVSGQRNTVRPSPLAEGLTVTQRNKRSATSLPRGPHPNPTKEMSADTQPLGTSQALLHPGHGGNKKFKNLADDPKRATTSILPTDPPEMAEKKRKAQKKAELRRRRQRKLIIMEHRKKAARSEPKPPEEIDYRMYSEEEIAIISDVLAREINFAREIHAVENGVRQEAARIKSCQSPEPEDTSEVCTMCNRVRPCALVEPLSEKSLYCSWICNGDRYERFTQLYSGGWYHKQDCGEDLSITTKMLESFGNVRHIGLSEELEYMARHQTAMGQLKVRLLYQEDLQFLMVGIVSASDLDIKLSSYSPKSKISVEVHLVPHLNAIRYTGDKEIDMCHSPVFEQLFIWLQIDIEQLERYKLQICVWLEPNDDEENADGPRRPPGQADFLLIGMTEFPLTTVPLNDKAFVMSLYPGEGREVFPPDTDDSSSEDEERESPEETKKKKKKKGIFGNVTSDTLDRASSSMQKKRVKRGQKKSGIRNIQTEVIKGGKVQYRAHDLRWTLEVFKQVMHREKEDKVKAEQKQMEELRRLDQAKALLEVEEEIKHMTLLAQKNKKLLKDPKAKISKDEVDAASDTLRREMEEKKAKEEKKKQEAAGPKLFELADEFEKEEAARHEDKLYVSPLENGKDYRLEVKRDLVQERRDFLAFIRQQFEDDPQLGLPSRTIHAVLIPVDRERAVNPAIPESLEMPLDFGQDEVDGSSDDSNSDSDSEEDDIVDGEDSEFKLGPGQKMKTKHKGGLPNGKLQVSLRLEDDVLSAEVIKTHGLWNFYPPGDMVIRSGLVVNNQMFMTQNSPPQPGAETAMFNHTQQYQKQALNRVLQFTVKQRGPKHFYRRRAANENIGDVLIDLSVLGLENGKEVQAFYPLLGAKKGKVFNRRLGDLTHKVNKGGLTSAPTIAMAGLSTLNVLGSQAAAPGGGRRRRSRSTSPHPNNRRKSGKRRGRSSSPQPPASEDVAPTERPAQIESLPSHALEALAKHRAEKDKKKKK